MGEKTKSIAKKPDIFQIMSAKYNLNSEEFLKTLKATVMRPGKDGRIATNEEVAAFLVVAHKYDLDPFTNEIYAYPSKKGGIIPVIGIDAYSRKVCNHKDFDGMDIIFSEDKVEMPGAKSCPEWCEVKLYRKGVERPVVVREYLDEVYRDLDYINPWKTHTKRMLRHKTVIQAGRTAGFLLSGVYDEDEAQRILEAEVVEAPTTKPAVDMPQAKSQIEHKPEQQPEEKQSVPTSDEPKLSTPAQQKAIHSLASRLNIKDELLYASLEEDYGVKSTKDLTLKQAGEVIEKFSKQVGKQTKNVQGNL